MADGITPVGAMVNPSSQGLQSLSNILGIQQQRQALQLQAQELQRSQVQTEQATGVNQFFSNFDYENHHGTDGTLDIDSAHNSPQFQALSGVAKISVDSALNSIRAGQLKNKADLANLNDNTLTRFTKTASAIALHPDKAQQLISDFESLGPDEARIAAPYKAQLANLPPDKLSAMAQAIAAQGTDIINNRPKGGAADTGSDILPYVASPENAIPLFTGQDIPKGLAPQVGRLATDQPIILGGSSRGGALSNNFFTPQAAAGTAPPARNRPSGGGGSSGGGGGGGIGPTSTQVAAQTKLAAGGAEDITQHYTGAQSEAARAETFTGIARNVQDFAHKAIVGTPQEKLNLMNGILGFMGIPAASDAKTASDLLQKNMSQLNLQGNVATDFKAMVTQMAQPHMEMSEDAIKRAAGQLIGQVQMKKAVAAALTPEYNHAQATGDQTLYRAKRDAINNVSDARIWEFNSMTPEEQKQFRRNLSPKDDAELGQKYKGAKALGLLQ